MNTKMEYMYRDANNYKKYKTVVLEGVLTPEQIQDLLNCRDEGEFFIAQQVGLPDVHFDCYDPGSDHPWMTLFDEAFTTTNSAPTIKLSVHTLLERFRTAKNNWKPDEWVPE